MRIFVAYSTEMAGSLQLFTDVFKASEYGESLVGRVDRMSVVVEGQFTQPTENLVNWLNAHIMKQGKK
jgi:hypothetical protein